MASLTPNLAPVRDWYASQAAMPDALAGDVLASWRARFRPLGMFDDSGAWHSFSEPSGPLPPYDGPRPDLFGGSYSEAALGPGGLTVRTSEGDTLHDREQAGRAGLLMDGWPGRIRRDLMPSGRREGARKGSDPAAVARALAWESLRLRSGPREAARTLLVWDYELETPFADRRTAEVVREWWAEQATGRRTLTTRMRHGLRIGEITLMRSCWRVLATLEVEDARSLSYEDTPGPIR